MGQRWPLLVAVPINWGSTLEVVYTKRGARHCGLTPMTDCCSMAVGETDTSRNGCAPHVVSMGGNKTPVVTR